MFGQRQILTFIPLSNVLDEFNTLRVPIILDYRFLTAFQVKVLLICFLLFLLLINSLEAPHQVRVITVQILIDLTKDSIESSSIKG